MFLMNNFSLMPFFQAYVNPHEHHLDYWSEDNPDAFWPRPYVRALHNFKPSDRWIQDAAYIRLKDIQIGYTLPDKLTSRIKISKLRLYFAGRDIWEITKTLDYIERLSEYLASKGKKYKSHYATILSWSRKDDKEKPTGRSYAWIECPHCGVCQNTVRKGKPCPNCEKIV